MFPAIVGLLLAILMPALRNQPPMLAERLTAIIAIWIVIAVIAMLYLFLKRCQRENHGGTVLLRPARSSHWRARFPAIFLIVLSSILIVVIFFFHRKIIMDMLGLETKLQGALLPNNLTDLSWPFSILGAFATAPLLAILGYGLTLLWWRVSPVTLEVREQGIGLGAVSYLPWEEVKKFDWRKTKHGAVLTISTSKRKKVAFVAFEEQSAVQALLEKYSRSEGDGRST